MFFDRLKTQKVSESNSAGGSSEETVYDKGVYVVEIDKIYHGVSPNTGSEYICCKFQPVAKIEQINGTTIASSVSGSTISQYYYPIQKNGEPNIDMAIEPISVLSWAATGIDDKTELAEEGYDCDEDESGNPMIKKWADALSVFATIKVMAWLGQQTKEYKGVSKTRNTVGFYKPLANEIKALLVEEGIETDTPF
jgi:hypothetical protein